MQRNNNNVSNNLNEGNNMILNNPSELGRLTIQNADRTVVKYRVVLNDRIARANTTRCDNQNKLMKHRFALFDEQTNAVLLFSLGTPERLVKEYCNADYGTELLQITGYRPKPRLHQPVEITAKGVTQQTIDILLPRFPFLRYTLSRDVCLEKSIVTTKSYS